MTLQYHVGLVVKRWWSKNVLCISVLLLSSVLYLRKANIIANCSKYSKPSDEMNQRNEWDLSEYNEDEYNATIPRNKTILFWTPFYSQNNFWELFFNDTVTGECPVSGCHVTLDRRLVASADAVVFHLLDMDLQDLPAHRPTRQLWVLFCLESPAYPLVRSRTLQHLNGLFNWTMTYRWDSDVPVPYGLVLPRTWRRARGRHALPAAVRAVLPRRPERLERDRPPPPAISSRRRLVAWMVSNCQTPGGREHYVTQLRKHIQVDVYGECGTLKCGRSESVMQQKNHTNTRCEHIISDYKFYLAFENTLCPDYATEKFFRSLALGTVPVVYGGAQYAAVAPAGSYIDARQHEPEQLARLLMYLHWNDTAYGELHHWRREHVVVDAHPLRPLTCGLCRRLHEPHAPAPARHDLHLWYSADTCTDYQPPVLPVL